MKTRMLCLFALALATALHAQEPAQATAQPAPAQTAPAPTAANTIRSTARLVVLDMVVIDAKGAPVTDLKRDEFHVTEAGDAQNILNFEAPGARTLSADLTINSTAELDKLAPRAPVNISLPICRLAARNLNAARQRAAGWSVPAPR